jgi:hypothetical protein
MVSRKLAMLMLASVFLIGSLSCLDSEAVSDKVHIKGTVLQPDESMSCGWGIRSEDGRSYEITNLPSEFRSPGLVVRARLQLRRDMASTCMSGPIAEVIAIEKGA